MRRKKVILGGILLILFCFQNVIHATNYYVKNGGNDSNSGLDDQNAWANHPWMITWRGNVSLASGDTVFMKRGDSWVHSTSGNYITVSQNGTVGHPITTTAYGSGSDPLIKLSYSSSSLFSVINASGKSYLVFDNLHIQHSSSTFGEGMGIFLYGISDPCHDITITNCEIDNIPHSAIVVWGNGYNIIVGDTTATKIATPESHSNHIHHYGYAGIGFQGANPSNGESHFYAYYNYIHDATRTNAGDNEYGIYFDVLSTASYDWPKYGYVRYNNVQNIKTWEGIECHGGSYLYFTDNYVKNFGTCGILVASYQRLTPTLHHIYVERNIVEQPVSGWVTGRENAFIVQFDAVDAIAHDIFIKDNECFYSSRPSAGNFTGIRIGNVEKLTLSRNRIYNGAYTTSAPAISILKNYASYGNRNVTITQNFVYEWTHGIDIEGPTVKGVISITNNIFAKMSSYGIYLHTGDIPYGGAISLYNNTFLSMASYNFYTPFGISFGGSFIAKNNIIGRLAAGTMSYWYWGGTMSGTFNCDFNVYWNSDAGYFYQGGAKSLSQWRTAGYDLNSPNKSESLDPLFKNDGGSFLIDSDFQLRSNSPARQAGIDVGISEDYDGNLRAGAPDIGAYEYSDENLPDQKIMVNSITITGEGDISEIFADGGTMQLHANVLPTNATDKSVTWTIINGTGQATINSEGMITALVGGSVTAKATAKDGSDVQGVLTILISDKQIIPVASIKVTSEGGISIITSDETTLQLYAEILPNNATDKTLTWSVENGSGQASITSTGLITGIKNGTVVAKATSKYNPAISGYISIVIQLKESSTTESKVKYIDPTNQSDPLQNGTIDHPYDNWSKVKWEEGFTYLQRRGTISKESKIVINASRVTLGSFGEGIPPIIQSDVNEIVLQAYDRTNIKIEDLHIIANNAITCVYFLGEECDSIFITDCIFEGAENGVRCMDGKNLTLSYSTFTNCSEAIYSYANKTEIYYNIFRNNAVAINASGYLSAANIFNNVFYDNAISIYNTYAELTLYNNIFYLVDNSDVAIRNDMNSLESDHNIFYPEQAGFVNMAGEIYNTLLSFQQSTGMDRKSFTTDPKFVDAEENNYALNEGSPAINSGMNVDLHSDFNGNTVPYDDITDIGILEFGSSPSRGDKNPNSILTLFPNPSRGQVNIQVEISQDNTADDLISTDPKLSVLDISGKEIYTKLVDLHIGATQEKIDLSELSSGMYVVVLKFADQIIKQKLLLCH